MSDIARGVSVTDNLDEMLAHLHNCLKRVVFAENFYVALYDADEETISYAAPGTGRGLGDARGRRELGQGSCFRVLFPQSVEAGPVAQPAARAQQPRGSESLLVVEDEPGVRLLITRILERRGYRVIGCSSGAAALEFFAESETSCDLVITDVVMPRMSGPELARRLARAQPGMKVLFISGHLEGR